VDSVQAQPWSASYRDSRCGIRKLNNGYAIDDPRLDNYKPPNVSTCSGYDSNIADNPVHVTLQDKLIGMQQVVYTRRAKFIAVSALTYDFMDTNGFMNSVEGELESGNLMSFAMPMSQFGFGAGEEFKSTYMPPVRSEYETAIDYRYRYYQYIDKFNDRAWYSLACVLDGICPVNFKGQLVDGEEMMINGVKVNTDSWEQVYKNHP
jgi:hypothetical protein